MARKHLSARAYWQNLSSTRGQSGEEIFYNTFYLIFKHDLNYKGIYEIVSKPRDLKDLYGRNPNGNPYGIEPDHKILNTNTGKAIFTEIKKQQAKGNAHERACKYFMPGLAELMRNTIQQNSIEFPIWCIFCNGILNPRKKYRGEIQHWFKGNEAHLTLWDNYDPDIIADHFDKHIHPLLS